jgi:V/A-type H+-transporting ATPase subunit I
MAIVEMQKIRLFLHRSQATDALRAIQKLGIVELTEVTEEHPALTQREKTAFEFNYVSSRLDFAVTFLSKYAPQEGALKTMLEGTRVHISGTELYQVANSFYYNEIIDTAQDLEKKINEAHTKIKDLSEERILLSPWTNLDLPLNTPRDTATTKTFFAIGKPDAFTEFEQKVNEDQLQLAVHSSSDTHCALTFFAKDTTQIEKLLRSSDIDTVTLPMRRGNAKEEVERIDRAEQKELKNIKMYEARAQKLALNLRELKVVSDYVYWQKNKHNVISSAMISNSTLVFEGWCPLKKRLALEERVANKTPYYAIEDLTPAPDEEPPVEIENNSIIKPFESVTRLYGLPGHKDLDPTLFLAGFFFIFFGLSLTDVGYGIILFLLTASALAFYRVPREMVPLLSLLMFGGIASAIVGLFFGGYFGVDMSLMPQWVQSLQAFDPISNPIPVFLLALGFGIAQIMVGLFLKIVREARNENMLDGILDQGPWIALFTTLILFGAHSFNLVAGDKSYYVYAIYAALASLVLTQGRKEKNIFMKLFKGVFSLYDSVSFFSDILSYSRLLALGLATSALAFAINLIAGMVKDVPYVGFILMAAILVVGHLFNMVVNILGAFIHSARLQFVEFFSKFITGSGRDFKPFKREERYVTIEK